MENSKRILMTGLTIGALAFGGLSDNVQAQNHQSQTSIQNQQVISVEAIKQEILNAVKSSSDKSEAFIDAIDKASAKLYKKGGYWETNDYNELCKQLDVLYAVIQAGKEVKHMADSKLIMRYEEEIYMNTGTAILPVWSRVGEGFTDVTTSFNAQEYSTKYISDITERSYLTGYAPEASFTVDIWSHNPAIERILEVIRQEKLGTDAVCELLYVDAYEWDGVPPNEAPARKRKWSIIPGDMGSGVEALTASGSFRAASDTEFGTFNRDTLTYTPNP